MPNTTQELNIDTFLDREIPVGAVQAPVVSTKGKSDMDAFLDKELSVVEPKEDYSLDSLLHLILLRGTRKKNLERRRRKPLTGKIIKGTVGFAKDVIGIKEKPFTEEQVWNKEITPEQYYQGNFETDMSNYKKSLEFIWTFNPYTSPFVQAEKAFFSAKERNESIEVATTEALKAAGLDITLIMTGQKLAKWLPIGARKLAELHAGNKSQKVADYVFKNPKVVLGNKQKWQDIYKFAFRGLNKKKKIIGAQIGKLKKLATDAGYNMTATNDDLLKLADESIGNVAQTDRLGQRSLVQIKRIIGGKKNIFGTKAKDFKVGKQPGIFNYEKWENILNDIDGLPYMQRLQTKIAKVKSMKGVSNSERLALNMRAKVLAKVNGIIENIPEVGDDLIRTKASYAKIMKANRLFKNITEQNMPKILRRSMLIDHETEFDVLQEIMPKDMFDIVLGYLLNEPSDVFMSKAGQLARPAGKLQAGGEYLGRLLPRAAAFLSQQQFAGPGGLLSGLGRRQIQETFFRD